MSKDLQTERLRLVAQTPSDTRSFIEAMSPEEKKELSADWLQQVRDSNSSNLWIHGFAAVARADAAAVGRCGFKGPPGEDGVVEIAYGVAPECAGKGYATEMAQVLVTHAFSTSQVHIVRAHTLPQANASTRVLTKCGFHRVGEVVDPEDGLVWRWEKRNDPA